MKAAELPTEQHEEVRAMFKGLLKPGASSGATLARLADCLAAHMAIEQALFYPAVLKVKEDLVLEGYEEHAVARFALSRLRETEYQRAVGRGGAAVTSASAPDLHG